VRRQITLLVAATTSIVLLAFLLPAASLVARVAAARALDTAQAQLQFLTPSVGLDDREQVAANLIGTSDDVRTAVRWTDGTWLGDPHDRDVAVPAGAQQIDSDAGTLLLQPVQRPTASRSPRCSCRPRCCGRRIGELLTAEREGAADLAHRLRTPLTALRLNVESLPPADRDRLRDDVDAVIRGVDEVISEARRTVREGLGAGCDATAVVGERVRFWSVLAEEEQRAVGVQLDAGPLPVRLAAGDLGAAVDALLGNVFAHTPEGTALTVSVRRRPRGGAVVTVTDAGPGMPGAAVERGRSGGGSTGLGLDIARRTAEASGGNLRIESSRSGTAVSVELGPPPSGDQPAPQDHPLRSP
jgi:signal transduction histidine kinase